MKLGMIGVGRIGELTGPTLSALEETECYAVASRTLSKAQAFAERYGFQRSYGSYEELLRDSQVELVYVATPHSHHYEHMLMALEHGKHVICEKSFTMNADQARKIRDVARDRGLFLAEAVWTRYMPSRKVINDVLRSGIIGKPDVLTANLSYANSHRKRLMDPWLAGGALLDVGVYGINFALMHFGDDIRRIDSVVRMTDTGVDGMENIVFTYTDGRVAVLTHICGEICRSCGENAAAAGVELGGKAEILLLSLPLIRKILSVAGELFGLGE